MTDTGVRERKELRKKDHDTPRYESILLHHRKTLICRYTCPTIIHVLHTQNTTVAMLASCSMSMDKKSLTPSKHMTRQIMRGYRLTQLLRTLLKCCGGRICLLTHPTLAIGVPGTNVGYSETCTFRPP